MLTGWIVRELGGNRFAQLLAATAVLVCPIYLTMDSFLSMNAFEPLFWMLCAAISLRIVRTQNPRLWPLLGLWPEFGILNKHSTLLFGFAFLLSLLMTRERRQLREPWDLGWSDDRVPYFLPNLVWENQNHWPTIEILRNVDVAKNAHVSLLAFIAQQAFLVHPLGAPICLAGLWYFLASREGMPFRFLGWTYLLLLAEMLILRGRIDHLAPIYPMLFAAGAVVIEAWIAHAGKEWMKKAVLAPLVMGGIVAAPLALPILPLDRIASYADFWDVNKVRVEVEPAENCRNCSPT